MSKTYTVTSEQLEQLDHLKYLLSVYAADVEKLCVLEDDSTDLNIGFELGKLYSSLRKSFMDFQELNSEIYSNKQKEEEEN
jgi:predicted Zn-dependent protease